MLIEDRLGERARIYGNEKAILVGLDLGEGASWQERESMEELIELSRTAGVKVLHTLIQKRPCPDPSHFIGKGKVEQLRVMAHASGADTIIFNDALTPTQARNLEEKINKKIIDRAQLIMSIFSSRAHSKEAKLQVELAQLEYLLPRLRGWGEALEQLGGRIGTRGPGEMKIEQERRQIKNRIHKIKERLAEVEKERQTRRKLREKREIPEIAIIGYTNTGKSTLLNKLCDADAFVEDKLFATLDTLTRKATLPDGREVVFIDTVGFIKKLPHQLIPAFQSTLEATREADLLLNVLDVSNPNLFDHWLTINQVLNETFKDGERPPTLNVLNKIDSLSTEEDQARLEKAKTELNQAVEISALRGMNLERLKQRIVQELEGRKERILLEIPYTHAGLLDLIHRLGRVHQERYEPDRIHIEASLERRYLLSLQQKIQRDGVKLQILTPC